MPGMLLSLSGVFVAMIAASIALGLPGGALADRLGPGRGLAVGAALRLTVITLGFGLISQPEYVPILAFLYSAASQLFSPAELALVPVVRPRSTSGAHATLVALQHLGYGGGALALAPLLYFVGGPAAMMTGALVIYVAVTALGCRLAFGLRHTRADYRVPTRFAFDFSRTLRFFANEPRATYAAAMLAFTEMMMKAFAIALPLYLRDDLHLSSGQLIVLAVPVGIGVLAGLAWAGRTLTLASAPAALRLALVAVIVCLLALAGLADGLGAFAGFSRITALSPLENWGAVSMVVALPAALLLGLCLSAVPIGARTILTETAHRHEQARVFSTQAVLSDLLIVTPLLLTGASVEVIGARSAFILIATLGIALFFILEGRRLISIPAPIRPVALSNDAAD
jgi:MFS family permease